MKAKYIPTAVAAAAALAVAGSHAATINLIDQGGVTGSAAEQGFNIAAGYWAHMLTNNATINLGVKFAALNPGIIGSTGSRKIDYLTADWQSAFNATKSSSSIDQSLILPTLTNGGFSGLTTGVNGSGNNDTSLPAVQINGKTASKVLYANSSVVKALGGSVANPNDFDGNVTFSSNFSFDFNPSNGITAGEMDFIGVAIHEIGHALGFVSGVDLLDYYSFPNGPGKGSLGYDLNDTSVFSALDMFRYSAPGQIDVTVGGTKYFSIDGGTTAKLIVDRDRTIDFMGENARVYATPMLVRDIELACRELLLDHLDPGEDSVGTRVEIDHLAATLMGQRVLLRLAVTEVKGRAVTFEVEGSDELDPICRGRHHRFVVDVKKTEERLAAKAAKVASAAKATG